MQAQSPVGKWKFVSYTQETPDGKITDQSDKCPADMSQSGLGTKWKMPAKNKITLSTADPDIDPVTYNFEIIGNKMRWTINYDLNDSKQVKQLVAEFIKA